MVTDIAGGRSQKWSSPGAAQREFTRFAAAIAGSALAIAAFAVGAVIYFASLPHEIPVWLAEDHASGRFEPAQRIVTVDDANKRFLLTAWIGAWRVGCNNPQSMCASQTRALVSRTPGDPVAAQVKTYNQAIADGGWTVSPAVTDVLAGDTADQYEVDWVEDASNRNGVHAQHVMRAFITLAHADGAISLHGALLNPGGEFIKDLRIVEQTHK